jgi:hypothetical protein
MRSGIGPSRSRLVTLAAVLRDRAACPSAAVCAVADGIGSADCAVTACFKRRSWSSVHADHRFLTLAELRWSLRLANLPARASGP